ncbi:MAG: hypothetical protein OEU50_17995 [Gammaproteobacteria bacterium]|nr:hypothetical protein [Gammaproteobacteria bacterium]
MKAIQLKPGLPQNARLRSNREPLYKRLPTHDEEGRFLSDFMMLIPGLRNLSAPHFETRLTLLHALLDGHEDVVFADLNTPLNLLWVSVRARDGVISDVSAEIRSRFPEAKLVGHTVADRQARSSGNRSRLEAITTRMSSLLRLSK